MKLVIAPGITLDEYTEHRAFEVFEKRTKGWILQQALKLTETQDNGIAALLLSLSCVEPMGEIISGRSKNGEKVEDGFRYVLKGRKDFDSVNPTGQNFVCGLLTDHLRNGLFHEAFFTPGIVIAHLEGKVLVLDGSTVVIDPYQFTHATKESFDRLCEEYNSSKEVEEGFMRFWKAKGENYLKSLRKRPSVSLSPQPQRLFSSSQGTATPAGVTLTPGPMEFLQTKKKSDIT